MKLKELTIEGYKSIGKITISNPNPFTVFVGPNASGKSNIFEALEFFELCQYFWHGDAAKFFGNASDIFNQLTNTDKLNFNIDLGDIKPSLLINAVRYQDTLSIGNAESKHLPIPKPYPSEVISQLHEQNSGYVSGYEELLKNPSYIHFRNFSRLFVGRGKVRLSIVDDSRLNTDASNLEMVLKRILKDENKKQEIFEILHLLIPGFESVEIATEELSGTDNLLIKEKSLKKPISKRLISDGTYNILAIIAAIYQSDTPQFLCIEEPENGLNPKVVKELGDIMRDICEEKGHYIWLNTHSQSLVSVLTKEEIIIVDKKNGLTEIKQIQDMNLHGLRMDDALYTNSIGGGNPW